MANYYLNDDGTLTKENKKKKGKNYILQEDGSLRLSQEDKDKKYEPDSESVINQRELLKNVFYR